MKPEYERLLARITPQRKHPTLVLTASYTVGRFDSHAVDCPFPFRLDGRYAMTFVGFDGIGYQTGIVESDDLLIWTERRLLIGRGAAGTFREYNFALTWLLRDVDLFSPGALTRVNGLYVGTYHAYPKPGYEEGPAAIGFCRSPDLVQWDITPPCLHSRDGAAWERGGLYKSCLVANGGRYYLFYNAKTAGHPWIEQTGLAVSDDLEQWERHPASPVVPVGGPGAFDEVFASDPCVFRAGDVWVMFYYGLSRDGHARDGVAFSVDLVHWEKAPGPILDVGAAGTVDSRYAHKPGVLFGNGALHHFYCAVAPEPQGHIGEVATSERRGIAVALTRDPQEGAEKV